MSYPSQEKTPSPPTPEQIAALERNADELRHQVQQKELEVAAIRVVGAIRELIADPNSAPDRHEPEATFDAETYTDKLIGQSRHATSPTVDDALVEQKRQTLDYRRI